MIQVVSVVPRNFSAARILAHTAVLTAALSTSALSTGCTTPSAQTTTQSQQLLALQARLDEAERTNGRLAVRIEELEDNIFLLHDRVDANRIALQRGGMMGSGVAIQGNPQKPAPTPQTYWGTSASQQDTTHTPPYGRQMKRIPLGGGDERDWQLQSEAYRAEEPAATPAPYESDAELVITERDFEAFSRGTTATPASTNGSTNGRGKQAQAPVTDQRLPTTPELRDRDVRGATQQPKRDALAIYKDGLAHYRGGDYREALSSFEQFLASQPQPDYIDNALYWIGECHFGLGAYDHAVGYFQRVMREQPDGNKVPDAMLKMSLAFDRVGRGEDATQVLEDLNRQYPATNAGRLATQRLAERK